MKHASTSFDVLSSHLSFWREHFKLYKAYVGRKWDRLTCMVSSNMNTFFFPFTWIYTSFMTTYGNLHIPLDDVRMFLPSQFNEPSKIKKSSKFLQCSELLAWPHRWAIWVLILLHVSVRNFFSVLILSLISNYSFLNPLVQWIMTPTTRLFSLNVT